MAPGLNHEFLYPQFQSRTTTDLTTGRIPGPDYVGNPDLWQRGTALCREGALGSRAQVMSRNGGPEGLPCQQQQALSRSRRSLLRGDAEEAEDFKKDSRQDSRHAFWNTGQPGGKKQTLIMREKKSKLHERQYKANSGAPWHV